MAEPNGDKAAVMRQLENEHPEWREPKAMPKPIGDVLKAMMEEQLPVESYSHDPWWIVRVQANAYRTAEYELQRAGFESYSPTYKVLGPMPLRMIPPKRRHQSGLYKREVRKRRFEGYIFVRRMFGTYDANRFFDLRGCGSIIRSVGSIAMVHDYEVELMRLVEADGTMDEVVVEAYRGYRVSPIAAQKVWNGKSNIVGRLDSAAGTVLFVERMGRIAQLISQADPP